MVMRASYTKAKVILLVAVPCAILSSTQSNLERATFASVKQGSVADPKPWRFRDLLSPNDMG